MHLISSELYPKFSLPVLIRMNGMNRVTSFNEKNPLLNIILSPFPSLKLLGQKGSLCPKKAFAETHYKAISSHPRQFYPPTHKYQMHTGLESGAPYKG